MKEGIKAYVLWILRKLEFNLSLLIYTIEPDAPDFTSNAKPTETGGDPVSPKVIPKVRDTTVLEVGRLPMDLLTHEYFTMPKNLRVYQKLEERYLNELISDICLRTGCVSEAAVVMIQSMETHIKILREGRLDKGEGTAWLTHYAQMCHLLQSQDELSIRERARIVYGLITSNREQVEALKGAEETLLHIKDTGTLPNTLNLAVLDLLAFANTPAGSMKRVGVINAILGTNIRAEGVNCVN